MAFISSTDIAEFTGAYGEFFDFFKREVVVYKTPQKTVSDISLNFLYGYGTDSNGDNYSYTPNSGIFSGIVVYNAAPNQMLMDSDTQDVENKIKLKVEETAKNYINEGQTESVLIDGRNFFIKGDDITEKFLTKTYYTYTLEETE